MYPDRAFPARFFPNHYWPPGGEAEAVDTHDGGWEEPKPWNKQPLPSLRQLRRLLGLERRDTPQRIEAKAEAIAEKAEAIEASVVPSETAPAEAPKPWRAPITEAPDPALARGLALIAAELGQTQALLARLRDQERRRAVEAYLASVRTLAAAYEARQEAIEAQEAGELADILASIN